MVLRSLFSGVSGLKTHARRLDVISNNIANVNTTAFKASRVRFEDVLSQTIEIATAPEAGRGGQNAVQVGLGVMGATISRDMTQGSIEITNNTTDIAVHGNGFFILNDGDTNSTHYTRDGAFEVDANGNLIKGSNGYFVQGWNGALDTQTQEWQIDSTQPVSDIKLDLFSQYGPDATSKISLAGNIDSRLSTAIDPVTVSWTKNGTTREVEFRFTHAHPTKDYYLWEVYDPSTIDPATGDYTKITTDQGGIAANGIVEIDSNGKIVANWINTADDDAADPATSFINGSTTEMPGDGDLWAAVNTTRTFNGYDYITLDSNGDGDGNQTETNSSASSVTSAASATAGEFDVTLAVPNAPISSSASTSYPNGFAADAVYQTGTGPSGNANLPGDGLGVPVQFIEAISNEVIDKIDQTRTFLQLDHGLVIGTGRENPSADGTISLANGTDKDSLQLYIDGREYTRIPNATAFTAGQPEYKLDEERGIITLGAALAQGVNAVASYSYEIRPSNTRSIPSGRTINAEFGAVPNVGTASTDLSTFYVPGSATLTLTDVSAGVAEAFTEVSVGGTVGANMFSIDPSTGNVTFGTFSSGAAVDTGVAGDTVTGSYKTYRRWAGEQTSTVADGTTVNAAEAQFAGLAGNPPYVANSVGSIVLNNVSAGTSETFSEVSWGSATGVRQFSVDPATGDLTFGTFFGGEAVDEANDTFNGAHNFDFFSKEIGVTDGAATTFGLSNGNDNIMGWNDLWRVQSIPQGGADAGNLNLWLQGDGFEAANDPNEPSATSLNYLPDITTTNYRAEINYESDDRVNIIIPNGLTKTPNIDPLTDKTAETFIIRPNVTQITGNAGNNNQADSGDGVSINKNNSEDYRHTTAVEVYDSLGTPWNLSMTYEKISDNLWLMYAPDPTDSTGQRLAGQRLLAFDADGKYDATSTIPFEAPTADGTTDDGFTGIYFDPAQTGGAAPPEEGASPVQITPDFSDLTQTAVSSDAYVSDQNGFPPGDLETFSFNEEGYVVGLFDNGRSRDMARVALQVFVNPAGLVAEGRNMFLDTVNAGKIGSAQRPGFDGAGTIVPGALEASNVDLSVEFVDLIITQRGFQAQSRTITTADQVLQEVLSLKR